MIENNSPVVEKFDKSTTPDINEILENQVPEIKKHPKLKKKKKNKMKKLKIKLSQTQMILARMVMALSKIDDDYYDDTDQGFVFGPLGPEHQSFIDNSNLDWINATDVNTSDFKRKFLSCILLEIAENFNKIVSNECYNDNRIIGFKLTPSEMISNIRLKLAKIINVIALTDDYKNSMLLLYRLSLSIDNDIYEDKYIKTYQKVLSLVKLLRESTRKIFFNDKELPYDIMVYTIFQLGYILVSNDSKCKYLPKFDIIENIGPDDCIEEFMIKFGKVIRKNVGHSSIFTSFVKANPWMKYTFADKNMNVSYGVLCLVSFFMDDRRIDKFIKNIKIFKIDEE